MNERRKILELFEENKTYMEDRIQNGIEQHRKGYADIFIKDANGEAVTDAVITVRQKSHAFKFGANLFMLDELETPEKNEQYKKIFAETFNMATLPFYWDATEPEPGKTRYQKDAPKLYRRPAIDLCIEFCQEHGIEPREHALAYDHFFPEWLYGASTPEVKHALEKRYREISERYADKIHTIEVTNEMDWGIGKGRTSFYEEEDYVEFCFKLAQKYFPANQLVINEHTKLCWEDKSRPSDKYFSYIKAAMLSGARIDAIGFQYHQFHKREDEYEKTRVTYDPVQLYKHMDMYAKFGKPLQVTEVTIPAYSWEPEDEEIQAEIIKWLYSIWFSHEKMEQIIYWNLVDGYAHVKSNGAEVRASQGNMTLGENYYYGGLLRFDMSPKPAFHAIKNLIGKEWHTEETLTANAAGRVQFKGFYGQYEVVIEQGGRRVVKELDLCKNGKNQFTFVL
ncbi:MAG: endo-1,4-beta-xylanase [Clostridia bacterium]|nr:endo-1,4-beta-xylanase [Clostridia bacterium]